jgi:mRNA-degrading endonuclease YafQ of YafQ-DinJ toxin-antitoxin module
LTGYLTGKGKYKIKLDDKRAAPALFLLASTHEAAFNEATTMLREYISVTPTKMMPPRLKELKGEWKGHYQLDFAGNHRLIYTVDEDEKVVYVDEIGPHPDWNKRRHRRRG